MDSRTIRIKQLEEKLRSARNYLRTLIDLAAECGDNHQTIKNSHIIKTGVRQLEFMQD